MLKSIPGTNPYKAKRVRFLVQGNRAFDGTQTHHCPITRLPTAILFA